MDWPKTPNLDNGGKMTTANFNTYLRVLIASNTIDELVRFINLDDESWSVVEHQPIRPLAKVITADNLFDYMKRESDPFKLQTLMMLCAHSEIIIDYDSVFNRLASEKPVNMQAITELVRAGICPVEYDDPDDNHGKNVEVLNMAQSRARALLLKRYGIDAGQTVNPHQLCHYQACFLLKESASADPSDLVKKSYDNINAFRYILMSNLIRDSTTITEITTHLISEAKHDFIFTLYAQGYYQDINLQCGTTHQQVLGCFVKSMLPQQTEMIVRLVRILGMNVNYTDAIREATNHRMPARVIALLTDPKVAVTLKNFDKLVVAVASALNKFESYIQGIMPVTEDTSNEVSRHSFGVAGDRAPGACAGRATSPFANRRAISPLANHRAVSPLANRRAVSPTVGNFLRLAVSKGERVSTMYYVYAPDNEELNFGLTPEEAVQSGLLNIMFPDSTEDTRYPLEIEVSSPETLSVLVMHMKARGEISKTAIPQEIVNILNTCSIKRLLNLIRGADYLVLTILMNAMISIFIRRVMAMSSSEVSTNFTGNTMKFNKGGISWMDI